MSDITQIKRALEGRARDVAEYLLPRGVLDKREWCVGSIRGEPGQSLKVCVQGSKVGQWADFAEAGESGDLIDLWCQVKRQTLADALGDIRTWLGMELPYFERRQKEYTRPAKPKCTVPKSAVRDYLTGERGLSEDALRAYKVGEDGRTIVFPSHLPDGTLAFIKHRSIDREPGKQPKTWASPDSEPVLFGWLAIDPDAREVTITEGEIDAMTSWDYGMPALSVPFGGGKGDKQRWIETEYDRLARFETIYLALDMDKEGNLAVEEIVNRLGRHRCRRLDLPKKDLNECRKAGISMAEMQTYFVKSKSLDPPELMKPSSFADAVVNLFWPTGDIEEGYQLPFEKIGRKLLFRPGELTEWTGATGAGKSQLLSYAMVAMADQGAKICMASFEMAPSQLIKRMVKQAGNVDRPTELYTREIIQWMDGWLWMFGLVGKAPVQRLLEVFEYARCRYGCDMFGIDSLMRLGISSDDYAGQEKAVFELVNWAVEKGVHVHLVAHARKSDRSTSVSVPEPEDVKGTSEIASNAANIIGVWRDKKREDDLAKTSELAAKGDAGAIEKLQELEEQPLVMINIAKQRNGDWEGKVGLWFNRTTYQYRSAQDDKLGRKFMPYVDLRGAAE